jgi:hypothetical protein
MSENDRIERDRKIRLAARLLFPSPTLLEPIIAEKGLPNLWGRSYRLRSSRSRFDVGIKHTSSHDQNDRYDSGSFRQSIALLPTEG